MSCAVSTCTPHSPRLCYRLLPTMSRSKISGQILAQLQQPVATRTISAPAWRSQSQHNPRRSLSLTFDNYHHIPSVQPSTRPFSTSSIALIPSSPPTQHPKSSGRPSYLATYTQRASSSSSTTSSPSNDTTSDSTFTDPDQRAMASGKQNDFPPPSIIRPARTMSRHHRRHSALLEDIPQQLPFWDQRLAHQALTIPTSTLGNDFTLIPSPYPDSLTSNSHKILNTLQPHLVHPH
jgi:hypothetical protein